MPVTVYVIGVLPAQQQEAQGMTIFPEAQSASIAAQQLQYQQQHQQQQQQPQPLQVGLSAEQLEPAHLQLSQWPLEPADEQRCLFLPRRQRIVNDQQLLKQPSAHYEQPCGQQQLLDLLMHSTASGLQQPFLIQQQILPHKSGCLTELRQQCQQQENAGNAMHVLMQQEPGLVALQQQPAAEAANADSATSIVRCTPHESPNAADCSALSALRHQLQDQLQQLKSTVGRLSLAAQQCDPQVCAQQLQEDVTQLHATDMDSLGDAAEGLSIDYGCQAGGDSGDSQGVVCTNSDIDSMLVSEGRVGSQAAVLWPTYSRGQSVAVVASINNCQHVSEEDVAIGEAGDLDEAAMSCSQGSCQPLQQDSKDTTAVGSAVCSDTGSSCCNSDIVCAVSGPPGWEQQLAAAVAAASAHTHNMRVTSLHLSFSTASSSDGGSISSRSGASSVAHDEATPDGTISKGSSDHNCNEVGGDSSIAGVSSMQQWQDSSLSGPVGTLDMQLIRHDGCLPHAVSAGATAANVFIPPAHMRYSVRHSLTDEVPATPKTAAAAAMEAGTAAEPGSCSSSSASVISTASDVNSSVYALASPAMTLNVLYGVKAKCDILETSAWMNRSSFSR
eukprot:GHRR01005621.1.p1 GENE.GHRR01005621.1~~GHRR01005621.1.p1  ORF type:complete len:655 (+),score=278.67 GHRR01005621.1:125-1966(+)